MTILSEVKVEYIETLTKVHEGVKVDRLGWMLIRADNKRETC